MFMNPCSGHVQSEEDWLADGYDQTNAFLVEVVYNTNQQCWEEV